MKFAGIARIRLLFRGILEEVGKGLMEKLKGFLNTKEARLHAQDSVPQTSPDIDYSDMWKRTELRERRPL